jgi:hypothetical protein
LIVYRRSYELSTTIDRGYTQRVYMISRSKLSGFLGKGGSGMALKKGSGKALKKGNSKAPKKSSRRTLKKGSSKALKKGNSKALRIYTAMMFLACIAVGVTIGWLTTKGNLDAAQIRGESLRVENEQYASSLGEANRLASIANEQIKLSNQQIEQAKANIEQLQQKLDEAERTASYWWQRAHPREFNSVDELKAWLAQDATNQTLYIFGNGCVSRYDCDDYAMALVRNALLDGYLVSIQIEGNHMVNSTVIGNTIYYIEPQTDEVRFWGYRDR